VKFYFCHRIFFLSISPGSAGLVRSSVLVRFAPVHFLLSSQGFQDSIYLSIFPKAEDLSVRAACQDLSIFPKAEDLSVRVTHQDLSVFPKAEDLTVRAACQDLSVFPKAEDLSVRAARQDLSIFSKAEDLSNFQVWDIGQVPVSNFDWLPFTLPSGRLLRSFVQCISFLLFLLLTLDERQISYSRSK
jgi:hypothetical protein